LLRRITYRKRPFASTAILRRSGRSLLQRNRRRVMGSMGGKLPSQNAPRRISTIRSDPRPAGAFLCRPGPPDRVTRYNPSRTGTAPTTPWLARGAGAGGHRLLLGIVNGPVPYMRMAVEARGCARPTRELAQILTIPLLPVSPPNSRPYELRSCRGRGVNCRADEGVHRCSSRSTH